MPMQSIASSGPTSASTRSRLSRQGPTLISPADSPLVILHARLMMRRGCSGESGMDWRLGESQNHRTWLRGRHSPRVREGSESTARNLPLRSCYCAEQCDEDTGHCPPSVSAVKCIAGASWGRAYLPSESSAIRQRDLVAHDPVARRSPDAVQHVVEHSCSIGVPSPAPPASSHKRGPLAARNNPPIGQPADGTAEQSPRCPRRCSSD